MIDRLKKYPAPFRMLLPWVALSLRAEQAPKEETPLYSPPTSVQELLEAIAPDYLASFPVEGPSKLTKEEIEKKKKKKDYDPDLPNPSLRDQAEGYLTHIAEGNPFLAQLFEERCSGPGRTILGPQVAQSASMALGPESNRSAHMIFEIVPDQASVLARIGALLLLHMPTADAALLKKTQKAAGQIAQQPALRKKLTQAYTRIKACEGSLLHLYEGLEDPLWSLHFQKEVTSCFVHREGKFVSSWWIELRKRLSFDVGTLLDSLFRLLCCYIALNILNCLRLSFSVEEADLKGVEHPAAAFVLVFLHALDKSYITTFGKNRNNRDLRNILIAEHFPGDQYQGTDDQKRKIRDIYNSKKAKDFPGFVNKEMGEELITPSLYMAGISFFLCAFLGVSGIFDILRKISQHLTLTRYISKRLVAFGELLMAAEEINALVKNDQVLEACLGGYLRHTRELLEGRHPDQGMRQLVKNYQGCDFRTWNTFLSSTGQLLTTMTLLQEHLYDFRPMVMELAWVRNYLTAAQLTERHRGLPNRYTFATFLAPSERAALYIAIKKGWNTALAPSSAVANDLLIDGEQTQAIVLMGPNACGKSDYGKMILKNLLLMQTFTIVAGQAGRLTPLSFITSFKEPQDDNQRNLSLFAMEMHNVAWQHKMLARLKEGQHAFSVFDEFLSSTNPVESKALSSALVKYLIDHHPNHASVIVTHNRILAALGQVRPSLKVFHAVIERHPDGSYTKTFRIMPGSSHERVGVDLAEVVLRNPALIARARKITEQISQAEDRVAQEVTRTKATGAQR